MTVASLLSSAVGAGAAAAAGAPVPASLANVAVCLVFLLIGLLLPRPKILERSATVASFASPVGLLFRRAALGLHGAAIVRELWCHFTRPGTFHRVFAALAAFVAHPSRGFALAPLLRPPPPASDAAPDDGTHTPRAAWYVTEADLAPFRDAVEAPGADAAWGDPLFARDYGTMTYTAWRRFLPDGKTEYKSTTVALDATAEEFTDFYLDDRVRPTWDGMIADHASLEIGDPASRCQVVRWRRSFPFAFLSDREYVIARRVWKGADAAARAGCQGDAGNPSRHTLYTATKTIPHHPAAPPARGVVTMDVFYSVWRSRTVPCPRGSGKPACETVLLHREDFKIPERMARIAVRAGMGGFVRGMAPAVASFVAARRQRVPPAAADPAAYGVGCAAAAAAAAARGAGPPPRLAPSGRPLPPARSCPQLSRPPAARRRVSIADPPTVADAHAHAHVVHAGHTHHHPHRAKDAPPPRGADGRPRRAAVVGAALAVALAAAVVGGAVAGGQTRPAPPRRRRAVKVEVVDEGVEEEGEGGEARVPFDA